MDRAPLKTRRACAEQQPADADHPGPNDAHALIEVGLILAGRFDAIDERALADAIAELQHRLHDLLPMFDWKIMQLRRPEGAESSRQEPSDLLQAAAEDRDRHHWDFAIALTADELVGHYRPYCFAALSRPLDTAVISTAMIDPISMHPEAEPDARVAAISQRLQTLLLHAIAHLAGLARRAQPHSLMYHPEHAAELEAMTELDQREREEMICNLHLVSDTRLEEQAPSHHEISRLRFFLHAAWINRGEIADALLAARPWQFPRRLSRLTTAAVSTVTILLMTAEAWDLGLDQPWTRILTLAAGMIFCTSIFVTARQQLLIRRRDRLTEQNVVMSVSSFLIVVAGMLSTWISMIVLALLIGSLLFDQETIYGWAENATVEPNAFGWTTYLRMALFTASLSILIGALGASFESQHYFRHVIFVDEEL